MSTQRYRQRFNPISKSFTYNLDYPQIPSFNRNLSRTTSLSNLGEETWDYLTPNFFKLKEAGAHLPVNPFTNVKSEIIFDTPVTSFRYEAERKDQFKQFNHSAVVTGHQAFGYFRAHGWHSLIGSPINTSDFPDPPNGARLLQAALANARTDGFDVGTFVAEANKTFGLIATAVTTLKSRARRVARDPRSNSWSTFSEVWLESRYGWNQLVNDIFNARESLAKLAAFQEGLLVRHSAFDSNSSTDVVTSDYQTTRVYRVNDAGSDPAHHPMWTYNVQKKRTIETRAGVGVVPRTAGSLFFADPLVTGWEVVPFSFILDWFFNVGQAINAWSPTGRVDLKHGFVTNRYYEDLIVSATPDPSSEDSNYRYTLNASVHTMTLRRSYTQRTPASPTFNLSFDLNLDTFKIVDLLTLLPVFGRRLRQFF